MKNQLSLANNAFQANIVKPKRPLILKRQWVVFFCFSSCFIMFLLRYNLSVAIVAIMEEKVECNHEIYIIQNNDSNLFTTIFDHSILITQNSSKDSVICYENKYKYDEVMVSQFLAAYFYGYAAFQLPFGRLGEKYGIAKHLIGYGVLLSGILSLLTPFMLDLGAVALIINRFLIGSLHAAILSCCYCMFADWLPKKKNASAICMANIGYELGGCASFYLTGQICNMDVLGWRYSFYLFAITSIVWFIPYHFMIYSRPEDDPYLGIFERDLIRQEKKAESFKRDSNLIRVPPKLKLNKLFTSGPVIASCFAKFSYGLGYYIITTKIPTYLKELFDMPIDQNGLWSASPLLGIFISKMACLKSISNFAPAFCLLLLTIKNDNRDLDILLIFLAMLGQGMVCAGDGPITAEMSGDLSGSIFGFTNSLACMNGFLAPLMVGVILENIEDKFLAWNIVFYIAIVVYVIGGLVFIFFASANTQEWGKPKYIASDEQSIA